MSSLMNFPWQWNWFQHWYWITCLWHFHFLEKVSVFNDFSQSIVMNRQVHFSEEYIFLAVHFFQGYIFPVVEHGSTFPGKWICLENASLRNWTLINFHNFPLSVYLSVPRGDQWWHHLPIATHWNPIAFLINNIYLQKLLHFFLLL